MYTHNYSGLLPFQCCKAPFFEKWEMCNEKINYWYWAERLFGLRLETFYAILLLFRRKVAGCFLDASKVNVQWSHFGLCLNKPIRARLSANAALWLVSKKFGAAGRFILQLEEVASVFCKIFSTPILRYHVLTNKMSHWTSVPMNYAFDSLYAVSFCHWDEGQLYELRQKVWTYLWIDKIN